MNQEKIALTLAEACVASGLSRTTLYKLMADGELVSVKAAGRRLILRSDLVALLHAHRISR